MLFMNFGIEHYAASFRDDFDTKINEFKHIKWFPLNFGTLTLRYKCWK